MAKQKLTGKVVSTKMQNTVVVEIERRVAHPLYKKRIKVSNKIKADSRDVQVEEGDTVVIESTRPISKTKTFKVIEKAESDSNAKSAKKKVASAKKDQTKKSSTRKKKGGAKSK